MDDLFINFNCDKGSYCVYDYEKKITHKYSVFYEKYLKKIKKKIKNFRAWLSWGKRYSEFLFLFSKCKFLWSKYKSFSNEIYFKENYRLYVDVSCKEIVDNLANHINEDLDLIIDDASHNLKDILLALPILLEN